MKAALGQFSGVKQLSFSLVSERALILRTGLPLDLLAGVSEADTQHLGQCWAADTQSLFVELAEPVPLSEPAGLHGRNDRDWLPWSPGRPF